jgi:hypothetical protein
MTNRKESPDLPALTQDEEEGRRAPVLTEGTSSMVGDIAAAVAIRDGDVCFLTDAEGMVPLQGPHGFGFYYRDCRYLNGYILMLADREPLAIVASGEHGCMALFQLTNTKIKTERKQGRASGN